MKKNKLKILPMTHEIFKQRRRVIQMLYDARNVLGLELPRIKVRIVDFGKSKTLGLCFIDKNYITISHKMKDWDEGYLRSVVWHELAHAYFGAPHDIYCPLMSPTLSESKVFSRDILIECLKRISLSRRKTYLVEELIKVQDLKITELKVSFVKLSDFEGYPV